VYLSWNASDSEGVIGYDIYRQAQLEAPQKLNWFPIPATECTDTSVQEGTSYTYWVTAVGAQGLQSSDSNTAFANIGSPSN
jgi:fibronectin type 3 domain-containing protein